MPEEVSGVLRLSRKGAVLLDPAQSFRRGQGEIFVPPNVVQDYRLPEGAFVTGFLAARGPRQMESVKSVCGLSLEEFQARKPFNELTPIDPHDRFALADSGNRTMRIVDLMCPIGKGTRGLIVSPPKAGKTTILEELARAIRASDPATRIVVLLIDERPEEVTHFRRAVEAEVLASTSDRGVQEQVELAELTLAHIRVDLECGRDVVVLVDSLTRMGRAFNQAPSRNQDRSRRTSGRIMSGGMEAGALEIPRKFFGLARNIEHGGSVTILATALVDTGSRMDEVIFQEFKGTGNCEIVLDRSLAEARIYPALNLPASGTRKEALLYGDEDYRRIAKIRRRLADLNPREAMEALLMLIDKFPTNRELLESIPLKD